MKGKRFSWILSGASVLGACAGMLLMSKPLEQATGTPGQRALWVGAFFLVVFVCGFCALQLAMALNKTYKVTRPPLWWLAFLVSCALVFGIGAGGQYLFMYSKEEVTVPAEVDMVLLLDASSSMDAYGYNAPRTDAACQFVDNLTEDCQLQVMAFAGTVLDADTSPLLIMDSANKTALKQLISSIDASGATDFNEPLQKAKKTLDDDGRKNCNKAVILLTDGESSLSNDTIRDYTGSDIRFFSIRISDSDFMGVDEKALADLAQSTGGFDTLLTPSLDGSIDTADMLQAFQDAFEATSETEINMNKDLIVYAEDGITLWQFLLRALVIVLCAIIIGAGYFGSINLSSVISSGAMGLVAAILVTVFEGLGYTLCALVVVLLVETGYVSLDLRGEDQFNV